MKVLLCLLLACSLGPLAAHDLSPGDVAGRWLFWPDYRLPGKAANYPGPRPSYPETQFEVIDSETHPVLFFGERPTERVSRLLPRKKLPSSAFSVEFWLVDHVNQPVGAATAVKGSGFEERPAWLLGYYHRQALFSLRTTESTNAVVLRGSSPAGWKKYWRHIVGTYDGSSARLYINGELAAEQNGLRGPIAMSGNSDLETAAYLRAEPHMKLGNLLREVAVHARAMEEEDVQHRFEHLKSLVEEGQLFDDRFHFTAGPYLNHVSTDSIRVLFETDRPATAKLRYGKAAPLADEKPLQSAKRIHDTMLDGLEPETSYFYEVIATDETGAEIRSGLLTFKTAVRKDSPFTFAIIGDTEARPHINDRIAKQVWGERPNFLVLVGDLTDGGQQHHKFEWNLEYFLGMNQLISRVPTFTVPGNGESDLHWYSRYHALPLPKSWHTFQFGNAEFFMLDSNRPMGPGSEQHAWLEEQLRRSTARWKFACHHHPTFSSDEDDYGNSWEGASEQGDRNARSVVPLYEKYKVDIVFFGHIHGYERTWPIADNRVNLQRGVRYVQTGGAGGNLEDFTPGRNWFSTKLHRDHHYCVVNVFEGQLRFQMFDLEGRLKDSFEMVR